jgi:hypothetical protein
MRVFAALNRGTYCMYVTLSWSRGTRASSGRTGSNYTFRAQGAATMQTLVSPHFLEDAPPVCPCANLPATNTAKPSYHNPPFFLCYLFLHHPGASAANSSSLRMPCRVSLICAYSASVRVVISTGGHVRLTIRKGRNWLGPPRQRTLDSRAVSLPRASRGAQPVSHEQERGVYQYQKGYVDRTVEGCGYLDVFRFWCWERLDEIFDLFGLHHEVVYEFPLVRY